MGISANWYMEITHQYSANCLNNSRTGYVTNVVTILVCQNVTFFILWHRKLLTNLKIIKFLPFKINQISRAMAAVKISKVYFLFEGWQVYVLCFCMYAQIFSKSSGYKTIYSTYCWLHCCFSGCLTGYNFGENLKCIHATKSYACLVRNKSHWFARGLFPKGPTWVTIFYLYTKFFVKIICKMV